MTNFEAITKAPEILAANIAEACGEVAKACGRKYDKFTTAKDTAIWLREEAHFPQK